MKHKFARKSPLYATIMAVLTTLYFTVPAFAATCNGVTTSIDYGCDASTDAISAISLVIINFMAVGVGIAVVGGIVWGALRYSSADGNAARSQEGIKSITNSVLGLILFIFMYAILSFLVPGGVFNTTNKPIPIVQPEPLATSLQKAVEQANQSQSQQNTGSSSTPSNPPSSPSSPTTSIPNLSGVFNFRSVGSTGNIYRSAALDKATNKESDGDVQKLSSLLDGGTIIDLRLSGVRTDAPDKSIPGVSRKNIPIASPTGGNYALFVSTSASRAAFGNAIEYIANTKGKVLIHCTYGKDRTGWLVAMIMYSLGASDSEVMSEYLQSNADLPSGKSVQASWLNSGISAAKSKYGSIDKYIENGLGVSSKTIDALKKKVGNV